MPVRGHVYIDEYFTNAVRDKHVEWFQLLPYNYWTWFYDGDMSVIVNPYGLRTTKFIHWTHIDTYLTEMLKWDYKRILAD